MANYDLIIRGARVIDAALDLDAVTDIGVKNGRIASVQSLAGESAQRVVEASGLVASAGWIDLHVHCFTGGSLVNSVHPDHDCGVDTGVTTVVDTGSFGASELGQFREIAERSVTRVLGYMNVSAVPGRPVHGDFTRFDQRLTIKMAEENRDLVLGIKVLASQRHCGNLGIIPLQLAVQAAREAQTGLMVHIGNAPPTIQEVLNLLGRGDIITHCFKGFPGGIMNRKGRPVPEAWAAAERGVLFDIGHGQSSFCFTACHQALEARFPFHSISTDLHSGNLNGPVYNLGHTMAKFLHLGLDLPRVVELVTLGPARLMRRAHEIGSLQVGACADVTLFRVKQGAVTYRDGDGGSEQGDVNIEALGTVRAGRVVKEIQG